jgi:hypothetical protein
LEIEHVEVRRAALVDIARVAAYLWSPPEQNDSWPAPVRMMAPMALSWWARWKASISCVTVSGRKALHRSGRLMVILAMLSAVS